jgi:nitrite reductase/ring-hydroxylating ferredoxin subunit
MNVMRWSIDMMKLSRRNFIKLSGQVALTVSGMLGIGALARFLSFITDKRVPIMIDLGPATDFPLGTSTHLPDIPALLNHDESGFTALDLTCTHLGCSVIHENNELVCPCHGSKFSVDGEVLRGPAKSSLEPLLVEQNADGNLILHKS